MALLLAVVGGCKQRAFMTEADYNAVVTTNIDDKQLDPELHAAAMTDIVTPPPTLESLDRKVRFLSLAEAIAIALEQGTVGQPSLLFPGNALDNLIQFTGRGVSGSDAIRVLAVDPARAGSEIEGSLSKFDAYAVTSLQYTNTDQPIGTPFQTFQAGASGASAIESTAVTGSMALLKPMATGGVAGITFNLPYNYTNLPARVNPNYQPQLLFQFEQPLLQGFGVEINQLRAAHPGSILNPNVINTNPTLEGIIISRVRFDEQRAEFERNVNQMLLNAEVAYWNLYGAYWTLYSREQGLRFAYEAYKLSRARYEAGQVKAADYYQTRGQYDLFRAQRIQAISTLLENERQLRALLGMPIDDGTRLMPSDSPTLAPYRPDWKTSLEDALTKRPELYMARQEIKVAQYNLILAKNSLLPDLRFTSSYDFNSIGGKLDGPVGNGAPQDTNALRALSYGNFSDWSLGLRMVVPIGFRFGHVQVRQAQITLARQMEQLKDQEQKAQRYLGRYYTQISVSYELIRAQRAQREAFAEQLRVRNQEYIAGRGTLDTLLEAQRFWADALANEYAAIVTYNNNLCSFEYAKGTILQHDNVTIAEGGLPCCAQVRAVDHERERTAALVIRERALPAKAGCGCGVPVNGPDHGVSLPAALAASPPLKDVPNLPATVTPGEPTPAPTEVKADQIWPAAPPAPATPPPAALMLPPAAPTTTSALPPQGPRWAQQRETTFGSAP